MPDVKDPLVIPQSHSWIDNNFFEKVLNGDSGTSTVTVKTFNLDRGSNVGDNYGGVMYKAMVTTDEDGVEKTHSLYLKCLPDSEFRVKLFGDLQISQKESNFYTIAVPKVKEFLKKHTTDLSVSDYFPKCFYAFVGEGKDVMVMENLRDYGYTMADRKLSLDYAHCKLVVKGLAQFHATSYALKLKEPDTFRNMIQYFQESVYLEKGKDTMGPFIAISIETMAKSLKGIAGCEHLSEKLDALKDTAFDTLVNLYRPKEPTAVLCLGDCWVNNLMFKYSSVEAEGQEVPESIKFLDFQMSRYVSPAADLLYFFYTSTSSELRKSHLDEFLLFYHQTFISVLKEVGLDPTLFSFEMLQMEWKDNLMLGLLMAGMVLGAVSANEEDIPEFDSLTEEDFMKVDSDSFPSLYDNDLYRKRLGDLVKEYEEYGLLV